MLEKIIMFFPKEVLVFLIIFSFSVIGFFVKQTIDYLNRNHSSEQDKINNEILKINNVLSQLTESLEKNNVLTNTCIYNDLDEMLRKAEITGIWSSSLAQQFEDTYARYLNAGDGLDGGHNLAKRAAAIKIDDNLYHDYMHKYNTYKKMQLEGV